MNTTLAKDNLGSGGWTLTEMAVVMALLGIVTVGALSALSTGQRMFNETMNELDGAGRTLLTLQRLVAGANGSPGLRMAEWDPSVPTPRISTSDGRMRLNYRCATNDYYYELNALAAQPTTPCTATARR